MTHHQLVQFHLLLLSTPCVILVGFVLLDFFILRAAPTWRHGVALLGYLLGMYGMIGVGQLLAAR